MTALRTAKSDARAVTLALGSVVGAALALLAALPACDGIGRAVVDRLDTPGDLPACVKRPPACDNEDRKVALHESVPRGATRVMPDECGAAFAGCATPRNGADGGMSSGDAGISVPTADAATAASCTTDIPLGALERADVTCQDVRATFDADTAAAEVHRLHLSNTNWEIVSTRPVLLTLDHASIDHAYIHLEGPVTLRITSALVLDDVGIDGIASDDGAPRIELQEDTARRLAIGGPEQRFEGALSIARSGLEYVRLSARTIDLDSMHATQIAIATDELFAADTALTTSRLDVGRAVLSSSFVSAFHVDACAALVLITVSFEGGEVPACSSEPLRAYSSNISEATIDGMVDSDNSTWDATRFGVHSQTDVVGWGGQFGRVMFCEHARSLRLGHDGNTVICSDCAEGSLAPEPLCVVEQGSCMLKNNFCAALYPAEGQVPMCVGEAPVRSRVRADR